MIRDIVDGVSYIVLGAKSKTPIGKFRNVQPTSSAYFRNITWDRVRQKIHHT